MTPPPPPTPRTPTGRRVVSEFESFAEHFGVVYDIAEDLLAIETEAAGAALAALREQVEALPAPGIGLHKSRYIDRSAVLALLSGAAPAAGEVARIGFPGQPFGYATGGNEPAPAAPAAPALDPERLAQALHELAAREAVGVVVENEWTENGVGGRVRNCEPADHLPHARAIADEYARLANPEKP